jgi:hypothetical protein
MLTVDGQSGTVYVQRGGTQTFLVGDLLDMPTLIPDFITGSNPDPDFYNFNGWFTSNSFTVYSRADCTGSTVTSFYNPNFQPSNATDSATMSGAQRTYSVRASQYLRIQWLERRIDIVDTVDETTTYPLAVASNCVTVKMSIDYISLLANGSTGPVTIGEEDPIGLQTDQPTGDGWRQQVIETDGTCVGGTVIAESEPGQTVGVTIVRPPGTYWYIVQSVNGSDEIYTNCVEVSVAQSPAELFVDGSTGPVTYVSGQSLEYFVRGFGPNTQFQVWTFYSSQSCESNTGSVASGVTAGDGTGSISQVVEFVGTFSVRAYALGPGGEIIEYSNCVAMSGIPNAIDLTVNGSRGPLLVMVDEELNLLATGLPPGSLAHAAIGCSGEFDPDDFGQVIGDDGVFEGTLVESVPDEFGIRVVLEPPSTVSSNCVSVRVIDYVIDPRLTVNGSEAPSPVEFGGNIDLAVKALPPHADAVINAFFGSIDCSGEPVAIEEFTQTDGSLMRRLTGEQAGPVSYRVVSGTYATNCVSVEVLPVPPTEVPTELPTEVPTGPIALLANGTTAPQVLAGGTQVELTTEDLGLNEPYSVLWYPAGDCTGTPRALGNGSGSTGQVGAMTRYIASTVGFQLTAGERTSNCVQVSWLAIPPTEPVTEEPTEPVTEEPTEPVTEEPTGPVTEEPTEQPTEQPTDHVTEEPTEPGTEEPTEPVTQEPTDPTTEEPTDPATGEPTAVVTDELDGSTPGSPGSGGNGSTSSGGLAGTGADPGSSGAASISGLPVTGATGGADRSPLLLLVLAAMLFAAAGSIVRKAGARP